MGQQRILDALPSNASLHRRALHIGPDDKWSGVGLSQLGDGRIEIEQADMTDDKLSDARLLRDAARDCGRRVIPFPVSVCANIAWQRLRRSQMSTKETKDRSGKVLDFQSHRSQTEAALPGIPSSSYIPLIQLAQRAEKIWCDETAALRQEEFGLLDIRDRSGAQVPPGSEHISLFDLDRDFVASRLAGLAAREDLQRRGALVLDAEATSIWDNIEATISSVKNWDAFVEAVRAYGRSVARVNLSE